MTSTPQRVRRLMWKWVVPLIGLAGLGLAAFVFFYAPRARTYRLTMTAGASAGTRHDLADMLRGEVAPRGLELYLKPSVGSEEALDWVNGWQIDCAFIQGGLSVGDRPNVRLVAMLHIEPLHLLVKKELFDKVSKHLTALEGHTVNTGEIGSGTHTLSVAVLKFAGLSPRVEGQAGGYIPAPLCQKKMQGNGADLPDAIFVVSSLPSQTARLLVTKHGYRLVPLPFGEAFALESLTRDERALRGQAAHTIDKGRTHATVIPAFTYGIEPPTPAEPLPTLGNRLLLVANKDVDNRAVMQLIEALFATEFAKIIRPPLDPKLMDMPPELPWHNGAELYRRRNQPVVSGDVLNVAQKGIAILAAGLSGLVVLWRWLRQRRQSDQAREFRQLLNQVSKVDDEAMRLEETGAADMKSLLALRGQLSQIRTEALDRFGDGELDDNHLMASLLAHVGSSRDHLTRLIAQRAAGSAACRDLEGQMGSSPVPAAESVIVHPLRND